MRVLLDTCVLSELQRPTPNQYVQKAIEMLPSENLYMSVLSIGEISKGICLLDDKKRQYKLEQWLQDLELHYNDRVLMPDPEICHIWGEYTAIRQKMRKPLPAVDGLIAATASRHGLHVVTRNISDFEGLGVLLFNPWLDS